MLSHSWITDHSLKTMAVEGNKRPDSGRVLLVFLRLSNFILRTVGIYGLSLSREVCDTNRIDLCFQKTPRLLLHGINRGAGVEVDRTVGKHGHLARRR